MIILAAMTEDRVIGNENGLPWNVPREYQDFLDKTRGQTIVMGRKTYEIFGKDLTSQHNIVISRGGGTFEDATTVDSMDEALKAAKDTRCRVYICGGASIYEQAIVRKEVGQMDLSIIREPAEGDSYFPEFDESDWELTAKEEREDYGFTRYKRVVVEEPVTEEAAPPAEAKS